MNTNLPRISVVTPSYNQAQYIGWTARSVLLQRYPNLEYIVMDGGSTDGSMDVIAPYADRFAHLVSERDNGQSDAIHKGFARSTGQIMAYLNSDDMLAPGTLHYIAQYFAEHPDVDVVYSHRLTVDGENQARWYWILPEHSNWYMMRWDLIPQETCFWRRGIFEKCGNVDPTLRFAIDYDLFTRFMQAGAKFVRINRFLGVFREHEAAKTSQWMETIGKREIEGIWKKYGIKAGRFDPYRSARFFYSVQRKGSAFAAHRQKLPGALAGLGYDYNEVWGGLLDSADLPMIA